MHEWIVLYGHTTTLKAISSIHPLIPLRYMCTSSLIGIYSQFLSHERTCISRGQTCMHVSGALVYVSLFTIHHLQPWLYTISSNFSPMYTWSSSKAQVYIGFSNQCTSYASWHMGVQCVLWKTSNAYTPGNYIMQVAHFRHSCTQYTLQNFLWNKFCNIS